jgi:multimeric flavodoxin WrbA
MRIIGVVCSPRVGGNTEILVKEAMSGAKQEGADTSLLFIRGKNIKPCDGCFGCHGGQCHIKDDMQEINNSLINMDGILIGTPLYWTLPGQAATFLDRTLPLALTGRLANKVGGAIVVAARYAGETVAALLRRYYAYCHMITMDWVVGYALNKGDVVKDEAAMKASFEVGRMMALFVKNGNKLPEEFHGPLMPYVYKKYGVARYRKP